MAIKLNNSVHNHEIKMKRGQRPYNDLADFIIKNNHNMTDKEMAKATMDTNTITPIRRIRYTRSHYVKVSPTLMAKMERNANISELRKLNKIIDNEIIGTKITVRNVNKLQRLFAKRDGIQLALKS